MSKPFALTLLFICPILFPSVGVRADEPKTADEVIAKFIEAMGGRKNIDAIKTMRMTSKMIGQGGMEIPMVIEVKKPNKVRVEITFQGMTGVRAFDGKTGWSMMPFAGRPDPEKMPPDEVKAIEDQADFDGPLLDYKKKGHQVEFMGKEEEDGSETYKLKVIKKNGNTEYHFLDAEAFLTVKIKGKQTIQGTEIEYEATPGDYKKVAGVMVPHTITSSSGPMGNSTITFDKVEVNVDLPDDRFVMPKVKKAEPAKPSTDDSAKEEKKAKPESEKE